MKQKSRLADKLRGNDGFTHFLIILVAVVTAAILNLALIINAVVPSGSMEPVIPSGQAVIGWRLAYTFSEPQRGDVVIFRHEELGKINVIKRIIAVPGDTVELKPDGVWINGELFRQCDCGDNIGKTFSVPQESYFMMGDNFDQSLDSRAWQQPYVRSEEILAKAIFGYFPNIYLIDNIA